MPGFGNLTLLVGRGYFDRYNISRRISYEETFILGSCTWQVDYGEEMLLVATRGSVVLGAATLAAVCGGSGYEVRQLGSAGGGGKALVERMLHLSQTAGAKFMATMPLDTGAATFWARAGFSALLLLGSKSSW